jgi:hypothetical protein
LEFPRLLLSTMKQVNILPRGMVVWALSCAPFWGGGLPTGWADGRGGKMGIQQFHAASMDHRAFFIFTASISYIHQFQVVRGNCVHFDD